MSDLSIPNIAAQLDVDKTSAVADVLLVEDSPSLGTVYRSYLAADNHDVSIVTTGQEALDRLATQVPDILLLDLMLPDMSGMDILRKVHEQGLNCAVIVLTAHGSIDIAIQAMQYGAVDFLTKPLDAMRLRVTVGNAVDKRRLSNMVERLRSTFARDRFHRFIGGSLPMQAVFRIIESAAPSKATVFVTGESGTGKELCADALHQESPRANRPFIAVNCAAIPRDLMESEIFGHVKGAFTGAVSRRDGAAIRAHEGTLFLDEVCEMDLDLQSKLLRFVQTGIVQRVGDTREEQVDIRIVCATNRDPLGEVRAGRFREDLYYRLNVIPIALPPLRDREEDLVLIASDLLRRIAEEEKKKFQRLSAAVVSAFEAYQWPGNVRELENMIRNIVVLNDGEEVTMDMVPQHVVALAKDGVQEEKRHLSTAPSAPVDDRQTSASASMQAPIPEGTIRPLWVEEKDAIERAIALCNDNVPRAAALLGVSPSTLYRKRTAWQAQGEIS